MIRVTQVLEYFPEPKLVEWQLRVGKAQADRVGEEARRIGTLVDSIIQMDLRRGALEIPANEPEVESALVAWMKWRALNEPVIRAVKHVQLELIQGEIVGHPDIVVEDEPTRSFGIIDVKAASMIRPNNWTQVAKYGAMYAELHRPGWSWWTGIIRLDKERKDYEWMQMRDENMLDYEVDVFEAKLLAMQHEQRVKDWMREQKEEEMMNALA